MMIVTLLLSMAAAIPPKPLTDMSAWIGSRDYPQAALNGGASGRTGVILSIDKDGLVSECRIGMTSGSETLDATTCALLKARGRFTPARDAGGRRAASDYETVVRWNLPIPPSYPLPQGKQTTTALVDLDPKGTILGCNIVERPADASGAANPCVDFPVGRRWRAFVGTDGKPIAARMRISFIKEFEPTSDAPAPN